MASLKHSVDNATCLLREVFFSFDSITATVSVVSEWATCLVGTCIICTHTHTHTQTHVHISPPEDGKTTNRLDYGGLRVVLKGVM